MLLCQSSEDLPVLFHIRSFYCDVTKLEDRSRTTTHSCIQKIANSNELMRKLHPSMRALRLEIFTQIMWGTT